MQKPKKSTKKKRGHKNPAIEAVHGVMRKKKVMVSPNKRREQNRKRKDVDDELEGL